MRVSLVSVIICGQFKQYFNTWNACLYKIFAHFSLEVTCQTATRRLGDVFSEHFKHEYVKYVHLKNIFKTKNLISLVNIEGV